MKNFSGAFLAFALAAMLSSPAFATLQNNLNINGFVLDVSNATNGFAVRDDQNQEAGVWFFINGDDLGLQNTTRAIVNINGVLSIRDIQAGTTTPILTEAGANAGATTRLDNLEAQTGVNSNLDPDATNTRDIGDNDLRWRTISLANGLNAGDNTTNGNLTFNTTTNQFEFDTGVNITNGDLIVNGTTIVNENGQLLAGADTALGNLAAQTAVNSDVDPAATATTNIGDNDLRWLDLFLSRNLNIGDNVTNGNLTFNTTTDQFEFDKGLNITNGDLIVNGTTIIGNGQVLLGANQDLNNLNAQTRVNSNLDPATTATTDLGDNDLRWRNISLANGLNAGDNTTNGNLTFNTVADQFEFDKGVNISNGTLIVNGTTIINENGQLLAGANNALSNLDAQTAVNSDVDPAATATTNIGDNDLRWLDLFLSRNLNIGDNTTNGNLTFNTVADQFEFDKGVNISNGTLIVNGTTIINENGQLLAGANNALSNLDAQTAVNSNVDPATTATTDLGDDALRWRSISLSDNVNIGEPGNNGNLTFNTTNNRFEFDRDVHVNENLTVNGTVNNVDINNLETTVNNNTQNINNLISSAGIENGVALLTLTNAVPEVSIDLTGRNTDHIDILNFFPIVTIDITDSEIKRGALAPVALGPANQAVPDSNVNVRFDNATNTLFFGKINTTGIDALDQQVHLELFSSN